MPKQILIIGAVAGGATAAAKARREDEQAEITVFERGDFVSFANCGLPYYIGGEIQNRNALTLMTPKAFWDKYRVTVLTGHTVETIDRQNKKVSGTDSNDSLFSKTYDALILSPGAQPIMPPLPGINKPHVMNLRSIPDMDRIHAFLTTKTPKTAVVIGGGFIGLEMAEAFHHQGLAVTIVELAPHILPPLDHDMAAYFSAAIQKTGFTIITGTAVTAINDHTVLLGNGAEVAADLVLVSAGIKPEVELAKKAGLALGTTGGIVVNDHMQTSDPAIYAVGDVAEVKHRVTGKPLRMPLAGPANRQGRIAAINATGGNADFKGVLGTSIVRVFDQVAGMTGLSQRGASEAGFQTESSLTLDNHHASYFPGAKMVRTKLIYEKTTGKLLGAQVTGSAGVDRRLDVLATALFGQMTVHDLAEIDLAYSPPFGTANDPVNTAGFVATHIVLHEVPNVRLPGQLAPQTQLIDVRNPGEISASGMLQGAKNIPLPQLRDRISELDPSKPVVLYCAKGLRGYLALRILKGLGFESVANINGGFPQAIVNGWPKEK